MAYESRSNKRSYQDTSNSRYGEKKQKFVRTDQPLLKTLVPNVIAGVIIGKGGSNLKELKSKYGGFVRVSNNREYYPGTDERVLIISGSKEDIMTTYKYVLEITADTGRDPLPNGRGERNLIVSTNMCVGKLIGKGGSVIKGIQDEFGIKMSIADSVGGSAEGERVVTMTGTLQDRIEACNKIIETIADDPSNMANTNTVYTEGDGQGQYNQHNNSNSQYDNRGSQFNNQFDNSQFQNDFGQGNTSAPIDNRLLSALGELLPLSRGNVANQILGGVQQPQQQHSERKVPETFKCKIEAQMEIPDHMVGLLMGKNGAQIKSWWKESGGARFRFSNKDEFVEGTTNRSLTISGTADQVKSAIELVQYKGQELERSG